MPEIEEKNRCPWSLFDPLLTKYHDTEWGVPAHRDNSLFEFLTLEGAQAGLSWLTVLKKRDNYRMAFAGFDPSKVSRYTESRIRSLKQDQSIIRNELKIRSTVQNAKSILAISKEHGSFNNYIWNFVGGKPVRNSWKSQTQMPAKSVISDAMSKDLKKNGFSFVGSTICYSFMQAVGMVNDHIESCFRTDEL